MKTDAVLGQRNSTDSSTCDLARRQLQNVKVKTNKEKKLHIRNQQLKVTELLSIIHTIKKHTLSTEEQITENIYCYIIFCFRSLDEGFKGANLS